MNKLYATKTKGNARGKRVLVGESKTPYNESSLSLLRERLVYESTEFDNTVKLEIENRRV